ncbi:MAG: tetratricopeptide repeat protein [Flavobacteriales bacterium]|nr:tetratricopeptide repeat protein [Flavobacteriales bacterium]
MTLLLGACKPGQETVASSPKDTPQKGNNKSLADLDDKELVHFKYVFHNANTERILGNYQNAAALFMQCIEIASKEANPYYELAHIYDVNNQFDLSLEYATKAIKLDPDNYWYRVLYAHELQRNGDNDGAIKQYQILIEQNGGNPDLYFDLGGIQLYGGRYKDAISTFDQLEAIIGITEEVSVQKEKIYIKLGDIDKAAREIQKLIDAYPDETAYQGMLAELYFANDMTEKAFEIYNKIIEQDPNNPFANLSLHDYYKQKGDDAKAFEALKKAFASEDLDIDTKMRILLSYYSATETSNELKKDALELNKILIEAHPNDAKAYTMYADFLYRDKKLVSAQEYYLKAIDHDSSKFAIWSQLMFIESELMDNDALLRDSKRAVSLFPNQPIFYFFYGSVNLQKKNFTEAAEYLEIGKDYVIDNPPLLIQFYASLGDAYNGLKSYEKSDKAYEKSLELDPKNIYVLNNYSYYLSLRGDNLERAEELSARCNELEPDQANYQDTYAWILYKQGKFLQARDWLEKAVENGGGSNAVILEHLGDTHAKLNNITKALEFWNKAKENEKGDASDLLNKKIADKKLYE